ncbi:hypothetical protein [uncultured Amphritea sp.]|uniref:hypothetical protein n=1 Tax=uncultured Amphritea sp. TaxID=981605 RepID=UPI0026344CBE|nr:hypothetical protein [uncultured Amphritea sp.]
MAKTPEQIREANRLRKQKQREQEAIRYSDLGIETVKFEILKGTRSCLDKLKAEQGFDDSKESDAELLTLLIHNLSFRDASQVAELLKVPMTSNEAAKLNANR